MPLRLEIQGWQARLRGNPEPSFFQTATAEKTLAKSIPNLYTYRQ